MVKELLLWPSGKGSASFVLTKIPFYISSILNCCLPIFNKNRSSLVRTVEDPEGVKWDLEVAYFSARKMEFNAWKFHGIYIISKIQ